MTYAHDPGYTIWDTETTIKAANKRKASPFGGINHVVASGWKRKDMTLALADYFGYQTPADDWFTKLLTTKLLVGFNIKFDILHAMAQPHNRTAWIEYVAAGGRVWDCQVAEYLLHGMSRENHMLSLDEVAPRYGGHLKDDAVKGLWAAGIDTTEIDRDVLLEYLIGAPGRQKDLGDIGNTETVFLGQVEAFRTRGAMASALLNMDSLLASTEMEFNGMHVDYARGLELATELDKQLVELRVDLDKSLPTLPFKFNWGSRFHLSALVFGGNVKYKAKAPVLDEGGQPVYYQTKVKQYLLTNGETTTEPPSTDTVWDYATNKAGKNAGEMKTKLVTVPDVARGPKERYEEFHYSFRGYTQPEAMWKTAVDGVYSTSADVIEQLGGRGIPFLESLAKMAALAKDLGTYFITTDEDGNQKGMLTLVGKDGIVHHSINHTSTVTARFSSSNPNLQNVSKGEKSQVKSLFTSRFRLGYIVQSDFTALEIYVQAILTLSKNLIEDLKARLDMHLVRLSQKTGRPYDELLAEYKAGDKDIKKARTGSKEFSFQRAYGSGVANIVRTTGMATEDVEALILAELERYPEVDKFYEGVTESIKANRVPTNRFVQHPEIPGLTCQLGRSHFITPDHKMYSYSEAPAPGWLAKRKGNEPQSFSPTEIKNYIVQGTGAEWAKAAMTLAVRMFARQKNFGGLAILVNQVHDAIYLDADQTVFVQAAALLHACMEEASAYMEYVFKWNIPVPVPTETKYGNSMIEELDMPEGFALHVASYRGLIRDTLMNGYVTTAERESNGSI